MTDSRGGKEEKIKKKGKKGKLSRGTELRRKQSGEAVFGGKGSNRCGD